MFRLLNESARRAGRLAARRGPGRWHRDRRAEPPAARRSPHRLDHRRGRRLRRHRGGVQLRRRHLPPVLHVPAGALRRGLGRRDRGTGPGGRARRTWPAAGTGADRRQRADARGDRPAAAARDREARRSARMVGAVAIGLGAIVELVVIDHSATDLDWLVVPLVIVSVGAVVALLFADALAGRLAAAVDRGASPPGGARLRASASSSSARRSGRSRPSATRPAAPSPPAAPNRPRWAAWAAARVAAMGGPGGSGNGGPPSFGGSESGGTGGPPSFGGSESGELPACGGEAPNPANFRPRLRIGESGAARSTNCSAKRAKPARNRARSANSSANPRRLHRHRRPALDGRRRRVAGGGMFGGEDLSSILAYTEAHGGGTIAVDSQSGASAAIIEEGAEVAGIGGFSGKESTVSAEWLEERIAAGDIAWIYTSGLGGAMGGGPAARCRRRAKAPSAAASAATPAPAPNRRSTPWSNPAPRSPPRPTARPPNPKTTPNREPRATGSGTLYECGDSERPWRETVLYDGFSHAAHA